MFTFSAKAQLRSSSRAFATARRRRPEVRTSPDERRGRCAATPRSPRRLPRLPPSARGAMGRRAARRPRHDGTRRTQRLERFSGTARDERQRRRPPARPTTSSTKVRASGRFLLRRVSRVAARVSPTTRSRRTVRGGARSFFSFFISFSDVCPTVTTTRQRKGRSERARARDAAAPISRRRCPSRALSRDDETPSREHETRVGKVFNPSRAEETPPRTRTLARRAEFYRFPLPSLTPSRTT